MNQQIKTSVGLIIIFIMAATAVFFIWKVEKNQPEIDPPLPIIHNKSIKPEIPNLCAQDAKQCSDGSYVSRTGTNCQFEACPSTNIAVDETANWQIYRNDKYGFEFKYPDNYKMSGIDYTDENSLRENNINKKPIDLNKAKNGDLFFSTNFFRPFEVIVSNTNYKNINDWFFDYKQETEKTSNYEGEVIKPHIESSDIVIQNIQGKKIKITGLPYSDSKTAFIKNNLLYVLIYEGWPYSRDTDNDLKIYNQILSTFKFTK